MAWYLSNDRMKDAHYNPYRTMSTHLSQYTKSCLFYILSYLCHHTTPICHHTVLSITLPEEHLKRHSFHSPLKLSTLKFSCGPSTTLNITRYTITKLINFCRTIKKLYSFSPKIPYSMCSFLSKFYVFFVALISNPKMM